MAEQVESVTITPTAPAAAAQVTSAPANDLEAVRKFVIERTPNAVPELIGGANVAELMASVDRAVDAYNRIAASVRPAEPTAAATAGAPATATVTAVAPAAAVTVQSAPNVPGGAHVAVKLDDLPPMELIRRGIAELKR